MGGKTRNRCASCCSKTAAVLQEARDDLEKAVAAQGGTGEWMLVKAALKGVKEALALIEESEDEAAYERGTAG